MKRTLIFALDILISAVIAVLIRIIIDGKISSYLRDIREYGDYYPLKISFVLYLVISFVLFLLYRLLLFIFLKKASLFTQASISGAIGVLFFYVFGAFFNGFTVTFRLTAESVKALSVVFVTGFILPYVHTWLSGKRRYQTH